MMRTPLYTTQRRKRVVLAAFAGLALFALVVNELVGESGYLARRQQHRQIQTLTEEIEKLKQENQQLGQRIRALRSDPSAIEELAREQLHLARPGEVIVTIPSPPPAEVSQPAR